MTTAYPLAWPAGWRRATSRRTAAFMKRDDRGFAGAVTVPIALERLEAQLDWLKVKDRLLSTNIERRLDGSLKLNQGAPADPGVALYFTLDGKPTVLACDRWDRVADNIVALAKHIEALRGIERWGVGTAAQAFAGYQALPTPEQWWQVLGLTERASVSDINSAYTRLARAAHPDTGGSNAAMARLNTARDAALQARS